MNMLWDFDGMGRENLDLKITSTVINVADVSEDFKIVTLLLLLCFSKFSVARCIRYSS